MNRFNLIAIATFSGLLLLSTADAGTFNQSHHPTPVLVSLDASDRVETREQIRQIAQAVTVKVLTTKHSGSGILISKIGQTYTVLTNAHVINSKQPQRIQTPDGKIHTAVVISQGDSLEGNDLALLRFQAKENYRIVSLATTANVSEQEVFAAGFPYNSQELVISSGKISLLSPQPLAGGYQIGYTNEIKQGMSGGPLLNLEGKLIGVNGLLNNAILNDTYVYQDGSRPSEQQLQRFKKFSFAIPIQTVAQFAPNLASILPKGQNQPQASVPPVGNNLVDKVDTIAQQITVRIDSKKNGNGSGAIVAKQGQTYYVVTALHVVKNPDSYEIVTPDGQRYALQQENIQKPKGLDAALLKFTSDKTYSVATIAKYNLLPNKKQWVLLSGFPGDAAGKRKFTAGFRWSRERVLARAEDSGDLKSLIDYGYELIYSNLTLPGMSGGPVLDSMGQVIGINTGIEKSQSEKVELGLGLGVPSSTLLGLATNAGLKPEWLKVVTVTPPALTAAETNLLLTHPLFAVEKPPQNANEYDWLNYGNQLWRLEKYQEAVAAMQMAIKIKPNFYQAYYTLGVALYSFQKKNPEALAAFEQATKIKPDSYQAWSFKSAVLGTLEKYPEALAAIDRAIEYNNDNDYNLYVVKGSILYELKRYSEALEASNKAIEIQQIYTAYFWRGGLRMQLNDFPGAIADYTQVIQLVPDYALAYGGRGFSRYLLKDVQGAMVDLNQAIKLQPDYATNYSIRGKLREDLKDFQGAIADLNQAIRLDPNHAQYYESRSRVHLTMRDLKAAIEDCNQMIKLQPKDASGYKCRGTMRLQAKDFQGAIADFNQAIPLAPDFFTFYSRSLAHFGVKDLKGSLADVDQAIKLEPSHANAYFWRANLRKQLKDCQGALTDFNRVIEIQPDNAQARTLRDAVRTGGCQ